ncbi:MAG TPA: HAD-IB family hydrolase [Methylococcaceae bacterium]|nr:HAD-IB family hydrolase [Methylococcaceae bacterium]
MALAIFDLDNTLLSGDSDYLWGQYLVDRGIVDQAQYEEANARFYDDYKAGTLNIDAFLKFALKPLSEHPRAQLEQWRSEFIDSLIRPILLPAAREVIAAHKSLGHTLMIITATNAFVTAPIAALYGIDHLIATLPEISDDRYTGNYLGTACFQEGKVERLNAWLKETGASLEGSWFYSDSHNDLPLLKMVETAIAVDPDETLHAYANQTSWPIITLRDDSDLEGQLKRIKNSTLTAQRS